MSRIPVHCAAMLAALQFRDARPEGLRSLTEADWNDLLTRAEFARLMIPLSQTCVQEMPEWVLARVDRNIASTAKRFDKIQQDYLAIAEAFRGVNARHLVVKGFALCPEFVAHPRFRMQSDIDIFCPPEEIERARDSLHAIGYESRADGDDRTGHHLPPLGKQTSWKWRGDLFDRELPIGLELHFRFSDETLARFDPQGLDAFWDRRITQQIDGVEFPTLCTEDHFGYSALHVVRHLLDGMVPIYSVFEIARFLDRQAANEDFWGHWRELHDESLRSLEAVCCKLAQKWFGCRLPREVQQDVDALPEGVHAWFKTYAMSPLEAWFAPNKDAVWLHAAMALKARHRRAIVLSTLVPKKLPRYVSARFDPDAVSGSASSAGWSLKGAGNYLSVAKARAKYHVRALPGALRSGAHLWWSDKNLSSQYWTYFAASFFFDFGMFIFFFLFNLFLLDCGYREKFVGLVTSVSAVGSVLGTIVGGLVAQRYGIRKTLLLCFAGVPMLCMLRVVLVARTPQLGLAFAMGVVSTMSAVCYSPTLAQTTNPRNRAFGFSLVTATLIGIGTLAGFFGGHLPGWIAQLQPHAAPAELKRGAIIVACAIMLVALWPTLRLRLAPVPAAERKLYPRNPFLLRYLPAIGMWALVTGSFSPFFNVYFSQHLKMPVENIGLVFSASNIAQVIAILGAPFILRKFGLVSGTMCMQIATAISLAFLAAAPGAHSAGVIYVCFMAVQWMSEPGMETLLMNEMSPAERSGASALNLFVSSAVQAVAAFVAGASFARFGYPPVLVGLAGVALVAAISFRLLLGAREGKKRRTYFPLEQMSGAVSARSGDSI
jgi:predicted MFS family arabinose efflux permease